MQLSQPQFHWSLFHNVTDFSVITKALNISFGSPRLQFIVVSTMALHHAKNVFKTQQNLSIALTGLLLLDSRSRILFVS
jgi:hypothetical protein